MTARPAFFYLPSVRTDGGYGASIKNLPELSIVVPNEDHPAYKRMIEILNEKYQGPDGMRHYGPEPMKEGQWDCGEKYWNLGWKIMKVPTTVYTEATEGGKRKTRRRRGSRV